MFSLQTSLNENALFRSVAQSVPRVLIRKAYLECGVSMLAYSDTESAVYLSLKACIAFVDSSCVPLRLIALFRTACSFSQTSFNTMFVLVTHYLAG